MNVSAQAPSVSPEARFTGDSAQSATDGGVRGDEVLAWHFVLAPRDGAVPVRVFCPSLLAESSGRDKTRRPKLGFGPLFFFSVMLTAVDKCSCPG